MKHIKLGKLELHKCCAALELYTNTEKNIVTSFQPSEKGLVLYGKYNLSDYFDKDQLDLPIGRIGHMHTGNPMYYDGGLQWFNITHIEDGKRSKALLSELKTMFVDEYGLDAVVKGSKVYVRHDEELKKIVSLDSTRYMTFFYVNVDCDYNKNYDYYKESVDESPSTEIGRLQELVNDFNRQDFINKVFERVAKVYGEDLEKKQFGEYERLERLADEHQDKDWVVGAELDNWFLPDESKVEAKKDKLEFIKENPDEWIEKRKDELEICISSLKDRETVSTDGVTMKEHLTNLLNSFEKSPDNQVENEKEKVQRQISRIKEDNGLPKRGDY